MDVTSEGPRRTVSRALGGIAVDVVQHVVFAPLDEPLFVAVDTFEHAEFDEVTQGVDEVLAVGAVGEIEREAAAFEGRDRRSEHGGHAFGDAAGGGLGFELGEGGQGEEEDRRSGRG